MRELKFRAFNKRLNTMESDNIGIMNGDIIFNEGNNLESGDSVYSTLEPDLYEIMQYTGLKDKNGKEIYEGDILIDEFKRWFVVYWRGDDAGYWILKYNDEESFTLHTDINMSIIGNIYENPELLEKE